MLVTSKQLPPSVMSRGPGFVMLHAVSECCIDSKHFAASPRPPSGLLLACSSQPVQASAGLSLVSATPILWSRLLKNAPPTSMYEEVAPAASTLSAAAGAGARKGSSKGSAARDEVSASVAAAVRAVIGADVEPDASLMASGLDSLGSVVSAGCGCL